MTEEGFKLCAFSVAFEVNDSACVPKVFTDLTQPIVFSDLVV